MGTVIASTLVARASTLLQDSTNVRWTAAELLDWLNEGQREIVTFKQNAYVRNAPVLLVAGTRQSLPADGVYLIDIVRNLGTDGTTPTSPVKTISREILDNYNSSWHSTAVSNTNLIVKNFMYNREDSLHYYIYPPQPLASQGYVELVYGAIPGTINSGDPITLDDIYQNAIVAHIMYRAWMKDAEYAGNLQLSGAYRSQFTALLGGKTGSEEAADPNKALGPQSPSTSGSQK